MYFLTLRTFLLFVKLDDGIAQQKLRTAVSKIYPILIMQAYSEFLKACK
jgi:hypothetical protein